jgi:hypothetical protein
MKTGSVKRWRGHFFEEVAQSVLQKVFLPRRAEGCKVIQEAITAGELANVVYLTAKPRDPSPKPIRPHSRNGDGSVSALNFRLEFPAEVNDIGTLGCATTKAGRSPGIQ